MSDPMQNAQNTAPDSNAAPQDFTSTDAESTASDNAELALEARITELEKKLAEAQAKTQENYDTFLRAKAETDNIRRRSAEEVLKAQKFGVEKMAEALLAV